MLNSKSNFTVGMKASTMVVIVALGLILLTMALPIILPLLWVVVAIAAGVGMIIGFVCLLGCIINFFKR